MSAEHLRPILRCGECDGSGIIYRDSDIGTVYCYRCETTGYGVLIRWPTFVLKWTAIILVSLAALVGAAILIRWLVKGVTSNTLG